MDTIIAIVPARGGSKGIKLKNIQLVNDLPLIKHVLISLNQTDLIDKIYVSTDNDKIISASNKLADIILRPDKLAEDLIISEDVILHALLSIDISYDSICVFAQCTQPFTTPEHFTKLINCINEGYDSATFWYKEYASFFGIDDIIERSSLPRQLKKPKKRLAGNGWAFRVGDFLKKKTRMFGNIGMIEITKKEGFDIDNPEDLIIADVIMRKNNG